MRRGTKQREAILEILKNTKAHPTVDHIYDEVRKIIPNISKGTVYRNLNVLKEDGVVNELNLDGTLSRYEVKQADHCHFRCEKCGIVKDVSISLNQAFEKEVERRTGAKITYHQLEFRGFCKECLN